MSEDTIVLDRNEQRRYVGAQNLNGITCYLNATLFAMFCRSDSCFDTLLYSALEGPVGRFATMLRLWVNLVLTPHLRTFAYRKSRSGWMVTSDVVAVLHSLVQMGDCHSNI